MLRKPAIWLSVNAFVSGAGGLRFESEAGRIGHRIAYCSLPLRHFFEWSCCCPDAVTRRRVTLTRYTFRRNTASVMKDVITRYVTKLKLSLWRF